MRGGAPGAFRLAIFHTKELIVPNYYRGYRLESTPRGVEVWYGCDLVETVDSTAIAHGHIDTWIDEAV